jgi:PAS domain S-box-containing protein
MSWNNGAERIFGYKAGEIIGQSITLLIPPELLNQEPQILAKMRAGERIDHFKTVRVRKDGRRIDVSLTISPVRNQQGEIVGVSKIARDISEQKKWSITRDRLAAIVDSSDDAIISKDLSGIITSWNKSAELIFGYTPEEIIGKSIMLLIPQELEANEPFILEKIKGGERIDHFETVRVKKNGDRIDVSLTVSPVRDEHGNIVGAAKIARDITRQKMLEAALQTSEKLASVGRLAATVAHEINNPLEAVINLIYLAKKEPGLSENGKRYLAQADGELARVSHIAQQTLGFYRDNSRPMVVRIPDIVKDLLAVFERKCKNRELNVEQRIEPGLTIRVLQGQLKQVLSNLFSNAIDASQDGGRIIIHARSSRHHRLGHSGIRITIADEGAGIPQQDRAKIFEPFFTTKREVGTGLGLWITQDLLKKSGGTICCRSRTIDPSGTVMSIFLPVSLAGGSGNIVN